MTRFDPKKNQKAPDEWSAVALNATRENNLQWNVVAGIVLGAVATSAASPLTGGLITAYFLWDSYKKARGIQRNQAAIVDAGCVAQVLDGDDFVNYASQVGHEAVMAELTFAAERNLPMSNAAADYFEDNYTESTRTVPLSPVQVVGANTRLMAVDTTGTVFDNYDVAACAQIDIINQMTDRITNTIIVGIPGSGKGMLVANALRAAKQKHPGLKVFVIDPKADEDEAGYFDGVADIVKRLKCENEPDEVVVEWVEKCFNEYYQYVNQNGRTLLFLDEGMAVGSAAERQRNTILQNKITSVASLGDKSGKNIWIATQTPFVNGLGIKLSASSQMLIIAIVNQDNLGTFKQWAKSSMLEKISVEKLAQLIKYSPAKRAVYFGKNADWYSMPILKNYSNFDRDTRTYINDCVPPQSTNNVTIDKEAIARLEASLQKDDLADSDAELSGFDFHKAVEILRTFKGKDWMKFGDARTNSKPLRKVTRDADDVRLIISFLQKDGEAETKDGDLFRVINKLS